MAELDYSVDALNARSAFFRVKTIIYVEGEDDILFWHEIFSQVTKEAFEVEPAGGAEQIDRYIGDIESGELHAIAARDSDFLKKIPDQHNHPRVVYTYGYSIENSLYISQALHQLTKSWCRSVDLNFDECDNWLNDFAQKIAPLVHLDLANYLNGGGVSTIGDNCTRFMKESAPDCICNRKVSHHFETAKKEIPNEKIIQAQEILDATKPSIINNIRGHFLASAILKYIVEKSKKTGRKANISNDSLYAAAVTWFGRSLMEDHPHKEYYLSNAARAWGAV